MMSRSVDLPQPLGPRRQTNSPSDTVRDTFSKASTVARFEKNRFETPSMMSLGRADWARLGLNAVKRHSTLSVRRVRSGVAAGTDRRSSRDETAHPCAQAILPVGLRSMPEPNGCRTGSAEAHSPQERAVDFGEGFGMAREE